MSPDGGVVVAIDQGKSRTRAVAYVSAYDSPIAEAATPGYAYDSSTPPDDALVVTAVRAIASLGLASVPDVVGLVSTAAPESRDGARTCAQVIARRARARRVLLAEDAVGAHLGALAGRPGVVVSAGTGSVALWTDGESMRRVDGWGPLLGDDGSGYDIGSRGLRAAYAAEDGRGPTTLLTSLARDYLPGLGLDVARSLHARSDTIALLSGFAPSVNAAADAGDFVSLRILEGAGRVLAATASVAAGGSGGQQVGVPASYTGRVFESRHVLSSFRTHLESRGLRMQPPMGDNLAGALAMARYPGEHVFGDLITDTAVASQ